MSPRSASGWLEWEEKNLLSWLDAHRELSWKARSDAYYKQHRVARGAESLRERSNQRKSKSVRGLVGRRASLSALPHNISAESNIDKWFKTMLTAEASQANSNGSSQAESSRLGRATRVSTPCWPKETRSSSSMWDYVHRVCAARKLE
ncbi:unnamed protein product [Penicillium salamii]|nr:unnamed protein product [Penicillium salamii]